MSYENYEKFLEVLNSDLKKIFENQREYICCKEGCSYCCEQGEYPFSKLEFDYLMNGFEQLDESVQKIVLENVSDIKNGREELYKCPFLVDKKCCLYDFRGIICRTFGIITKNDSEKTVLPFCYEYGLNYSKVYDKETKKISPDKILENDYNIFPRVFDLSRRNIKHLDIIKDLNIDFGEERRLIDWFD